MKIRILAACIALISIINPAVCQNKSIQFIEKPWSEILDLAKSENKMIFLDAYTSWCGPCKWMAANMFTKDSIADLYNKTFINAHFDMEKGEGLELARAYQVRAYPTLLFLNNQGEMVHIRVGAPQKVSDFIEMVRIAQTPGEGFNDYQKKFAAGERNPAFMLNYLDRLQGAYIPVSESLEQYFSAIADKELFTRANWNIIFRFVNDMNSREFIFLQKNHRDFEKLFSYDSVYQKLYSVYVQALMMQTRSRAFSESGYEAVKQNIRNSGFSDAEKVIFSSELMFYQSRSEFAKYLELAFNNLEKFYSKDYNVLNQNAGFVLQISNEKKYLEKALDWAKQSINLKSTPDNNDIYASLAFKLGDSDKAVKYETIAIELAQKEKVVSKKYEDNLKKFQQKKPTP